MWFFYSLKVFSEKLSSSRFKVLTFIFLPVFNPVLVAVTESLIFRSNGIELIKSIKAALVCFHMLWDMIFPEASHNLKLVIVIVVEFFALLSFPNSKFRISEAICRNVLLELLCSKNFIFLKDTFFKFHLGSLEGILDFNDILWIRWPLG